MNLKEKLEALQRKNAALVELASAGTLLSDEQIKEMDTTTTEIESVTKQIAIIEKAQAQNAALRQPVNQIEQPIAKAVQAPDAELKARVTRASIGAKLDIWEGNGREEKAQKAYDFGMWALSMIGESVLGSLATKAADYCKAQGITKAHYERDNETGGFLVPDQFVNTIIDLRNMYGQFRQFAKVQPMSGETASIPRRTGGLTAYWGSEGGTLTASTKAWDKVNLIAKKLYCYAVVSSELSEDSVIDLANDLASEMAYQLAYKEDLAGYLGDGGSDYGGIVGVTQALKGVSTTIANIAGLVVGAGNAYSELTLANFRSVMARCPTYARRTASWHVSPVLFYETMVALAESAGGTTKTEIINGTPTPIFMGYPVQLIEVMPSTEANSQVCALFGDVSKAALLGDRRRIVIARSDERLFDTDEIAFKATERIDINVHSVGNASATASLRVPGPVVGLITAAS